MRQFSQLRPTHRVWGVVAACFFILLEGIAGAQEVSFRAPIDRMRTPRRASALADVFRDKGYVLKRALASGHVPRIYVRSIPLDMSSVEPVKAKKDLFIRILLPLVLKANDEIEGQRAKLSKLRNEKNHTAGEAAWLADLAESYSGSPKNLGGLLARVDTIPPALALAQGIDESGWGTSRFARMGDSLFGQHGSVGGSQLGAAHAEGVGVAAFDGMLASVQAYLKNLNSGRAYRALRQRRADLRAKGTAVTGGDLVLALDEYSERGEAYVRELQSIIRVNGLEDWDHARLSPSGGSIVIIHD